METLLKLTQKKINELEGILKVIDEFQNRAPQGRLKIQSKDNNTFYYQQYRDEQTMKLVRKYIKKEDDSLIRSLAQKCYYLTIKPILEQNLNALKRLLKRYHPEEMEKVYEELSEERKKLITPLLSCKEEWLKEWQEETYEPNHYFPENLKYETEQGEMVRSKSEVIIANTLYQRRKDILYKYERPLRVTVDGYRKTIYPDFTILNIRTGKIVYWEHAGLMDEPVYANDFVRKANTYMHNDLFPGKDVFFTYESVENPLETGIIKEMVNQLIEIE